MIAFLENVFIDEFSRLFMTREERKQNARVINPECGSTITESVVATMLHHEASAICNFLYLSYNISYF